jgi:hypothetical protein
MVCTFELMICMEELVQKKIYRKYINHKSYELWMFNYGQNLEKKILIIRIRNYTDV